MWDFGFRSFACLPGTRRKRKFAVNPNNEEEFYDTTSYLGMGKAVVMSSVVMMVIGTIMIFAGDVI